jgi:hypothetical protein
MTGAADNGSVPANNSHACEGLGSGSWSGFMVLVLVMSCAWLCSVLVLVLGIGHWICSNKRFTCLSCQHRANERGERERKRKEEGALYRKVCCLGVCIKPFLPFVGFEEMKLVRYRCIFTISVRDRLWAAWDSVSVSLVLGTVVSSP